MSLSSLIVQREIATIRQVEEAMARQVLYGGDLITNLLEVAQVDEKVLLTLAAESVGLVPAPFGVLPPPEGKARDLIPLDLATRRSIYPLRMTEDGEQVVIILAEPLSLEEEEQLMFALGFPVVQRLGAHVRVRQALSREYGAPMERRLSRLLARMSGDVTVHGGYLAPQGLTSRKETPHGFPAAPPPDGSLLEEPHAIEPTPTERQPAIRYATLDRETGGKSTPASRAPPPRRRRGPFTFVTARDELEEAADRDALLDLFFDFVRQYFEYAALFVVHGDVAEGRDAFGQGASRDRVVGIGIPLDMGGLLATARDTKAPIFAAPAKEGLDDGLMADLGRTVSHDVLVVPVVVRNRAVALLYGDSGDNPVDRDLVADVLAFALLVGQNFERLILKKKLGGGSPGAPALNVGRADSGIVFPKKKQVATSNRPGKSERAEALGRALLADAPPRFAPAAGAPDVPWSPRAKSVAPPEPAFSNLDLDAAPLTEARPRVPARTIVGVAPPAQRPVSATPPPPMVTVVRRPSGPPIPREDPVDATSRSPDRIPPTAALPSFPPHARTASEQEDERAPEVDARALNDEETTALLAEIEAPRDDPEGDFPPSQSFASAPRRPPLANAGSSDSLPSVIVDVARELEVLLERFVQDPSDDAAEAELLRQGNNAMPAIVARFPGEITFDPRTTQDDFPPVSACGPILRLIAGQRRVALPSVLERAGDPDDDVRFWATFLLSELPYPDAVPHIVARLSDRSPVIRRVARLAARASAKHHGEELARQIGRLVRDAKLVRTKRIELIGVLEEIREPLAVPTFISVLEDENDEISAAARGALMIVARQDFGRDTRRWTAWWNHNSSRERLEWLMDALTHDLQAIRHAAGEELKTLTKEYFGYYDDLPKRERERAQQRYRDWWTSEGRARFTNE